MAEVTKSIVIDVPVHTAYNQWTQFEEFPKFMEGVQEVKQLDEKRLHWVAEIGGKEKQWDAEVTEQVPDQVIAWKATDGTENSGMVRFQSEGPDQTRIDLQLGYEPDNFLEKVGSAVGLAGHRVEADLERFKKFIEERGQETGAYRESIGTGAAGGAGQGMGQPSGGSFPEPGRES